MSWPEVKQAEEEGRYELVLTGEVVSERIEKNELDMGIFKLATLNFLQITNTKLTSIPDELGKLEHLKTLDLHKNMIKNVPRSIVCLKELKYLDLSANAIEELPEEIGELKNVQTLNVNFNKLGKFPYLGKMKSLGKLDVSHNQLTELPGGIYELAHLAHIQANSNHINRISGDISKMSVLKVLDLSDNKISAVPQELSECTKMKDLSLVDNCIKDNRLGKMIKQCSTKAVLDYVASTGGPRGKGKKTGKKGRSKSSSEGDNGNSNTADTRVVIRVIYSDALKVVVQQAVLEVRPYIVCAVMRNLDLTDAAVFKKFIAVQTKLHESLCDQRTFATIATHSLCALQFPLLYDAAPPSDIHLVPLGRHKEMTAEKLVADLRTDALKQKQGSKSKRNPFKSGLYKFLTLVEGAPSYACVRDSTGMVISLPPVTNSEHSKIKAGNILDVFVEVTSSVDLPTCKKVMDALIQKTIEAGLSSVSELPGECSNISTSEVPVLESGAGAGAGAGELGPDAAVGEQAKQELIIEQVRVVAVDGQVKVAYPSRVDLQFESVKIVYEEKKGVLV